MPAVAIPGRGIPAGAQISPGGSQGPTGRVGYAGPPGEGIRIKGTVETQSDLPSSGNAIGDIYITADDDGWVWDNGLWNNIGPLRGLEGPLGPQGIKGDKGELGKNAYSRTAQAFFVPPPGTSITIALQEADWVSTGQMLYIEGAAQETAGIFQCLARNGKEVTLLNPPETTAFSMKELLDEIYSSLLPAGAVLDFTGPAAPPGFLLCNGAQHSRIFYPRLFAAIGYIYGGSGLLFNVPDYRSRLTMCAGQGAGLSHRALTAQGGSETVALTEEQMPWHWHTVNSHQHIDCWHQHVVSHAHNLDMDHWHYINTGGHGHGDPGHAHAQGNYAGYEPGPYGFWTCQHHQGWMASNHCGLHNAGDFGGHTWWVSSMIGGWQIRTSDWRAPATDWRAPGTSWEAPGTDAKGAGWAHENMPPFFVCWKMIKT